jgi:ubiquinone/menaquinone biosynthesis C-methylase UbiE
MTDQISYDEVYGSTFARYTYSELVEFTNFFEQRFSANKLNATDLFYGKTVLDCGCGNGRGSVFAVNNGAKEISAIDTSITNIISTKRNLQRIDANLKDIQLGTLESMPFPSDSFDVVWCNGVLMHTAEPDKCLQEVIRVLKPGGRAWIYVYGSGGVYWRIIETLRSITKDIKVRKIIDILDLMMYTNRYISEYIDDWKVPYLRKYTKTDFSRRLQQLGCQNTDPLKYGVGYDTSHRLSTYQEDRDLWGEGDLRYLVTKTNLTLPGDNPISSGNNGSNYSYSNFIENQFGPPLKQLEGLIANDFHAVASAAFIQYHLRKEMSKDKPFDCGAILKMIHKANSII